MSTKIHQKCQQEFTHKMSTKIHPKRGRGQDVTKSFHEMSATLRSADINQKSADLIWCKLGDFNQDKTAD